MMYALAAALVLLSCAAGLVPHANGAAVAAAERFVDRGAQLAVVLNATPTGPLPNAASPPSASSLANGFVAALLALAFAALALFGNRLPRGARAVRRALGRPFQALRALHDGVLTDYVAWLAAGAATLGTALAVLVR